MTAASPTDAGGHDGLLVVLEGVEGVGKTTQLRRLGLALSGAGGREVVMVREPGGTAVGDAIRRIVLDDTALDVAPRAEALLFMASRAQLVRDVVRPALARGAVVLADRFLLSTYAYQVAGRGLPEDAVRAANALATGGLVPSVNLLLTMSAEEGLRRAGARGGHDRMELAGREFLERVADAFASFAEESWQRGRDECGPVVTVDAHGDEDAVFARLWDALAMRWPATFTKGAPSRTL